MTGWQSLSAAARTAFFRGEVEAARAMLPSVAEARSSDAPVADKLAVLLAHAHINAQMVFQNGAQPDPAREAASVALSLALASDDMSAKIGALDALGATAYYDQLGRANPDYTSAHDLFAQMQSLAELHGTPCQQAMAAFYVGLVQQMTRQDTDAEANFWRSYDLARAHGCKFEQSYAVRHLGGYQRKRGDYSAAVVSFTESLSLREQLDARILLPFSYLALADVYSAQGDHSAALDLSLRADSIATTLGLSRAQAFVAFTLGECYHALGDVTAAHIQWQRAKDAALRARHEVLVTQADQRLAGR